jgi:hypothetical protein
MEDVAIAGTDNVFRVYRNSQNKQATAVVFIHGAGHSALSWALTSVCIFFLILHHFLYRNK